MAAVVHPTGRRGKLVWYWLGLGPLLFHLAWGYDFFNQGSNNGGGGYFFQSGFGRQPVDNDEYYKTLGLPKTCTDSEIKKAYRRLAIKMHPDKGGDEAKFKQLRDAYDVLSNAEKRKIYDTYGKAGLEGGMPPGGAGGGGGPSPEDVFSAFFHRRSGPRQAPSIMVAIEVPLEDLYKGTSRSLRLNRQKVMNGRLVDDPKILEVVIEKGTKDGQRIVLHGEAEGGPNVVPGDIIIEVKEQRHPRFIRRNGDLLVDMKISLTEALTGFERSIKHLDQRELWIRSKKGEVTAPGSIYLVEGEGMPIRNPEDPPGKVMSKGRLFIRFSVDFPRKLELTPAQVEALEKILPKTTRRAKPDHAMEAPELKASEVRYFGGTDDGQGFDDENDWMGPGMRTEGVQCHQQ